MTIGLILYGYCIRLLYTVYDNRFYLVDDDDGNRGPSLLQSKTHTYTYFTTPPAQGGEEEEEKRMAMRNH